MRRSPATSGRLSFAFSARLPRSWPWPCRELRWPRLRSIPPGLPLLPERLRSTPRTTNRPTPTQCLLSSSLPMTARPGSTAWLVPLRWSTRSPPIRSTGSLRARAMQPCRLRPVRCLLAWCSTLPPATSTSPPGPRRAPTASPTRSARPSTRPTARPRPSRSPWSQRRSPPIRIRSRASTVPMAHPTCSTSSLATPSTARR